MEPEGSGGRGWGGRAVCVVGEEWEGSGGGGGWRGAVGVGGKWWEKSGGGWSGVRGGSTHASLLPPAPLNPPLPRPRNPPRPLPRSPPP